MLPLGTLQRHAWVPSNMAGGIRSGFWRAVGRNWRRRGKGGVTDGTRLGTCSRCHEARGRRDWSLGIPTGSICRSVIVIVRADHSKPVGGRQARSPIKRTTLHIHCGCRSSCTTIPLRRTCRQAAVAHARCRYIRPAGSASPAGGLGETLGALWSTTRWLAEHNASAPVRIAVYIVAPGKVLLLDRRHIDPHMRSALQ